MAAGDPIRTPHRVKQAADEDEEEVCDCVKFGVHSMSMEVRKRRVNGIRADKPVTIQQPRGSGQTRVLSLPPPARPGLVKG